jgi:hypothetical protein
MPGIVMHHHFGKVVYSALPEEVKKVIYNVDLFDFATTGPNAFSYINFLLIGDISYFIYPDIVFVL